MALEDLLRYESAAVAATNAKEDPNLSLIAMQQFYGNSRAELEKLGYGNDPTVLEGAKAIAGYFNEAQVGLAEGTGISSAGLITSMKIYSNKYTEAFSSTKISDLTKYLTDGFNISGEVKSAFAKYNELTLEDLGKKAKEATKEEQEDMGKLMQAISILKERRFKVKSLNLYDGAAKMSLEQLYSKPKEEKKD